MKIAIVENNIKYHLVLDKEIEITQETQEGLQFYIKSEGDIIDLNYLTKEIEESIPITGSLYIKNNLNESLNNLKISLTGNLQDIVKLETTEFDLATDEEKRLDIIINEDRILLEDSYSGDLIISNDKSFTFPMTFNVVEAAEEPESLTLEEVTDDEFISDEDFDDIEEPECYDASDCDEGYICEEDTCIEFKSNFKWAYLLVLVIILIIFAYISLRKPKEKKQSFKQFLGRIKP